MPKTPTPAKDLRICAQREEYTAVERETWKRFQAESVYRMFQIMPLVPGCNAETDDRQYWGKTGTFACPACEGGTVRWTRAPNNGHVWASCSTPNCFQVMQ